MSSSPVRVEKARVIQPATELPDPGAEYWTTSDVAAFCGVEVGTISSYRKRAQMPAPDLTVRTRTHLWRPGRIVEWREEKLKKLVPDPEPVQTA